MGRLFFVALALVLPCLNACSRGAVGLSRAPAVRPNVVVIVIDTLRADAMGAYGNAWPTSPELDQIAKAGVRFQRAVSQSSWTRPSFASFLTSRVPRASGISQERLHALPDDMVTLAEVLHDAGYTTLGVTANPNVNSTFKFDQGFDAYVDSGVRFGWMQAEAAPGDKLHGQVPLRPAPEIFQDALNLLEKHQADHKPVYMQLVLMDVHEHFAGMFAEYAAQEFGDHPDRNYFAALRFASSAVGRFVNTLQQRPGFENTMVVITSDHGEGLRSHPHVSHGAVHGYLAYESQTVVPLIVAEWGPIDHLPSDFVVDQPVRLLDLMPTLLDLVGIQGPAHMEGRSLRVAFEGKHVSLPDRFVVETRFRNVHALGVYGDEFAYVENRLPLQGTRTVELHRLGGTQDGAVSDKAARFPTVVKALKKHLDEWEQAHAWAEPSLLGQELPSEELEQLRALGYAQ